MMYRIMGALLASLLLVSTAFAQDQDAVDPSTLDVSGTPQEICEAATPAVEPATREYEQPEQVLEDGVDYRAIMCTSAGAVYIDLLEGYAPETVNNFVFLAENNYYNNTIFHRVMQDFMAQGGDPTGTGTGGPGYQFADEFTGFLVFDRPGQLAMANAGPGTNGSQFFITTSEPSHLNYQHTIFGEVLEGYENVEAIQLRDPQESDAPATDLNTVVIVEDPSTVETTYEPVEGSATPEDFIAGLNQLSETPNLPDDLREGIAVSEELSTDAVISNAADDAQAPLETLLTENGHAYRVQATMENTACTSDYFFESLLYRVDAFESADAVDAVLDAEALQDVVAAQGFEALGGGLDAAYYAQPVESCNAEADGDAEWVRVFLPRGRYLVTLEAVLPPQVLSQISQSPQVTIPGLLETNISSIFEVPLADIYRAEIN